MGQRNYCVIALIIASVWSTSAGAAYVGNPIANIGGTDGSPPLVIIGQFNSTAPEATSTATFPSDGIINDVQLYSGGTGLNFTVYTLGQAGLDALGNQQFKFLTGSTFTTTGSGAEQFPMSVAVQAGDLLAFSGQGPVYSLTGNDATYQTKGGTDFVATPPTVGGTYSFGTNSNAANYVYIPVIHSGGVQQAARTYAFGVDVSAPGAHDVEVVSDDTWRTSKTSPPAGWNTNVNFDDSDAAGWQSAFKSPSGNNIWYGSNKSGQSPNNAWFRHVFTLNGPVSSASATVFFDDNGQFYLNGHLLVDDTGGGASSFDLTSIDPSFFVIGENLLAVHGVDTEAPFSNIGIDLTLTEVPEPSSVAMVGAVAVLLRRRGRQRPQFS
jgi:hypothetical protein